MKSFVITIKGNSHSEDASRRCIKSIKNFDVNVFDAVTPKDNPLKLLENEGIPHVGFTRDDSEYTVVEPCISAFLSHYSLWKKCIEDDEEYQIFEHDAVAITNIPEWISYDKVISLGQPSYGKFRTPEFLGSGPLTSKPYFPGAHAYRLKPKGAKILVDTAKTYCRTTDIYLDIRRFPFLQEFYPWPVVARDGFTTLQKEKGCLAKHGYSDKYEILT